MQLTDHCVHFKVFICFLLIAFFSTAPAGAVNKQDILLPYKNNLAQCNAALDELQRQAGLHQKELEEGVAFLEARHADLDAAASRLRQEFEASEKILERMVLTGWQLVNDLEDAIHIPGQGFTTIAELRKLREAKNIEFQQQLQLLEQGDLELYIDGIGLISRNMLEQRLLERRQGLEDLRKSVEAGEYVMFYPGLGEVDRRQLDAHKQLLEERIADIEKDIASGDYVLVLPGLGPVSKNSLKVRIENLKQDMADLKQHFKDGGQKILRASIQWSDANTVKNLVQQLEEQKKQLARAVKEQGKEFMLPMGWITGAALREHIAEERKTEEDVQTRLRQKNYEVALPDGTWADEKDIEMALLNAVIAPEIRDSLRQGLRNIEVTAKYEMARSSIQSEKLQAWLDSLAEQARPHLARLDFELKWKKVMLDEFRREEQAALRWMEQQKRWLERCLRYLP